jgi:uncharacterized protein
MRLVELSNPQSTTPIKIEARYCDSFFGKFKGLMFDPNIPTLKGLLLVENGNSVINTSIHMFFMFFDIGAVWINSDNIIVDAKYAKKWYPFYFPQKPAQYILECHPSCLNYFHIGDTILIKDV